jgi:hypothetical protein
LEQGATRKITRFRNLNGSARIKPLSAGRPFTGRFAVASQASKTSTFKMCRMKQSKSVFHLPIKRCAILVAAAMCTGKSILKRLPEKRGFAVETDK